MNKLNCFLLLSLLTLYQAVASAADRLTPDWISGPDGEAEWTARSSVTLAGPAVSAKLKFAVDFAQATVTLNNHIVVVVEPYCPLTELDVSNWMQVGPNQISVQVKNSEGPSAIAVQTEIQQATGQLLRWGSDTAWVSDSGGKQSKARSLGSVRPELWGAGRRDIELSPVENYEQWRQSLGSESTAVQPKFWSVPGFDITHIRSAAADENSWISLTQDPQGRMIISREDQGLLRMTLNDSGDAVSKVEQISVDLKECRGLAFHDEWLYANANNSKGLYRLQIGEDGSTKNLACLREFPGSVGHGRNDITIADGWLYTIHGDSVDYPHDNITDLTSPVRHWSGDVSQREGQLLRMHLKTGQWEVVCAGLRNPYGITAHPSGELFTFDADNEFDMGTPWYRPTRFLALNVGGDVGYRTANGRLPPRFHDQPENLPPVLNIGRSSPTAVFCDPKLKFPEPYREAVYLLDWTYGRILAVHLAPRGAGWRAHAELFLQGRPLNVTDVATGPDGAMYIITGGRKTQSALYRVAASTATNATLLSAESHEQAANQFAIKQSAKRAELELIARQKDARRLDVVWATLGDADPVLRNRARIALERLPADQWRIRVNQCQDEGTWLYAALALAQVYAAGDVSTLLERWLKCDLVSMNLSEQFVWLRLVELCLRSNPQVVESHSQVIKSKLLELWPAESELHLACEGTTVELRQRLAQLLGELQGNEMIPLVVTNLLSSTLQEDRLAGLLALRKRSTGWSDTHRRAQFEAIMEAESMVGGEGLPRFVEALRSESLATLTDEERVEMQTLLETKPVEYAPTPQVRRLVRNWKLADLQDLKSNSIVQGDRTRGAKIFEDALCARCHRVEMRGKSVGPDLTFVGRRFSLRDLLESIIEPSRSVAENYRMEAILTHNGAIHKGRIVAEGDYRSEKIKLQTDALRADAIVEIEKKEIAEHRLLELSPMPDNLLDTFDESEIRDLLAYLQSPAE